MDAAVQPPPLAATSSAAHTTRASPDAQYSNNLRGPSTSPNRKMPLPVSDGSVCHPHHPMVFLREQRFPSTAATLTPATDRLRMAGQIRNSRMVPEN